MKTPEETLNSIIPCNWTDPLLTGPDAIINGHSFTPKDIENLLNAIRERGKPILELYATQERIELAKTMTDQMAIEFEKKDLEKKAYATEKAREVVIKFLTDMKLSENAWGYFCEQIVNEDELNEWLTENNLNE